MISLSGVVQSIVLLIVSGLIFWLLYWLINYIGLPEPFNKIARVILAVSAVIVCICILLSLAGYSVFRP